MRIDDKSTIEMFDCEKRSTHDTRYTLLQCTTITFLAVIYCYFQFLFLFEQFFVLFCFTRCSLHNSNCTRHTLEKREEKRQVVQINNWFDNLLIDLLLMCEMLLFKPLGKCFQFEWIHSPSLSLSVPWPLNVQNRKQTEWCRCNCENSAINSTFINIWKTNRFRIIINDGKSGGHWTIGTCIKCIHYPVTIRLNFQLLIRFNCNSNISSCQSKKAAFYVFWSIYSKSGISVRHTAHGQLRCPIPFSCFDHCEAGCQWRVITAN